MRKTFSVLSLLAVLAAAAPIRAQTPEASLARGTASYHTGDYASAVADLQSAAQQFFTPIAMDEYVVTGRFDKLPELERALVYLALAQFKLGREDDARETIRKLVTVERIAPVYVSLALENDRSEFEALALALLPESPLPKHTADDPSAPLPAVRMAAPKSASEERAERQRIVDELVNAEQARVTRETEARIEEIRRDAETRIAAARAEAERRVQLAEADAKREADARIAEIRREPSDANAPATMLREADSAATSGDVEQSVRTYARLASAPDASREVLTEAAIGLYRHGAFREAVAAFHRLGTFAKGEEDLRYYNAVSLYETGRYEEARKELACALPFIQLTDDVTRYRAKIER